MKVRSMRTPPSRVFWHVVKTPAEKLVLGLTENNEVCRAGFLRSQSAAKATADWRKKWPYTEFHRGPKLTDFMNKPILLVGTDFQCAVWRALAKIPYGQTLTYGDIARRIGKPNAERAVGQACGSNPVPYFIPCHRVVSAKGIGGFSSGLEIKIALLKAESSLFL
jgi:methylated-DNA-[protein]-cysteine S-methyltransferase